MAKDAWFYFELRLVFWFWWGFGVVVLLVGRGVEAMMVVENGSMAARYPLYDTHGNMVATMTKTSAGLFGSVANERKYDVWGGVREGAATGGSRGRYVANLGHVADDESDLIYMRARYYEPSTGRFLSEDDARQGSNWYIYASQNPCNRIDFDGRTDFLLNLIFLIKTVFESVGFSFIIERAIEKGAEYLAKLCRKMGHDFIKKGMEHQAAAAALAGRQDFLSKIAAGVQGRLGAKNLSAGLALLSISNFLKYSDEFMGSNYMDDLDNFYHFK